MGKKIKKTKSKSKEVSNANKKHVSKKGKTEDKKNLGVAKDKNIKFKAKLNKNAKKFSSEFKEITKNGDDLINLSFVKLVDIKSEIQNKKLDGSSKSAKKQKNNTAKININNKEQRKKSEYTVNTKKKQEKLNTEKMNAKNKNQAKKSDHSAKNMKKQQKLSPNKNKQKKREHDQIVEQPSKKTNASKKLKKDNRPLPRTNNNEAPKLTRQRKKTQNADNGVENMKSVLKKKQKQEKQMQSPTSHHKLDTKKLEKILATKEKQAKKEAQNSNSSLRERMMTKLRASRFRYLNETLYNSESSESKKYFRDDPDAFKAYHDGYKQQVEQWPLNPLDVIISSIKKMPKDYIVADFGCGEARLATSVTHKVHSFDFVSLNDDVTVCDMAHTPLLTNGVHIVVFCLSLMGTNLKDYVIEANRVLKKDGILKIAEVESRFEQVDDFIKLLSQYGFKNTWKELSHNMFHFLDFKKEKDIGNKKNKLPPITLKPCLYKKR